MRRPGSRDAEAAQTRRRLATTALDLFETQGYDQVSVSQVAAAAGVTERTVFRHFRTKQSLILDGEPHDWAAFLHALERVPAHVAPGAAVDQATRDHAPSRADERDDRRRAALIRSTPTLQTAWLQLLGDLEPGIRGWLARRWSRPVDAIEVMATAACLVAVHRVAVLNGSGATEEHLGAMTQALSLLDRGLANGP